MLHDFVGMAQNDMLSHLLVGVGALLAGFRRVLVQLERLPAVETPNGHGFLGVGDALFRSPLLLCLS